MEFRRVLFRSRGNLRPLRLLHEALQITTLVANKNRKLAAAFDLPPEVEELPPELAKAGPLTVKQRNKEIRYRDKLMEFPGTPPLLLGPATQLHQATITGE